MPGKKRRPRAESGADPGAVPALAPAVAQSVQEPMVRLGTIVGPHGIRGAVRVKTYTEDPMSIAAYGPVFDRAGARRFALRVLGPAKAGALAVIDGVSDRNAAEAMRGLDLYVPRHALPETADEDEFYNADLIGLQVEDMAGRPLGRVCDGGRAGRRRTGGQCPGAGREGSGMTAATPWSAWVLTIYPDMFPGPLGQGVVGRGLQGGAWGLHVVDIRGYARDKHASVDDVPYGGGPGMVMRPDVVAEAVDAACAALTPRGRPLTQARLRSLAAGPGVVLLCGRFEGIDERLFQARACEEVSLGDFVLSGGEVAAMAVLDGVVRLLPGVVGSAASLDEESFAGGLLEYPHYTRPRDWEGHAVPEVLLSGHHGRIAAWRQAEAERTTRLRRPDLWSAHRLQPRGLQGRDVQGRGIQGRGGLTGT